MVAKTKKSKYSKTPRNPSLLYESNNKKRSFDTTWSGNSSQFQHSVSPSKTKKRRRQESHHVSKRRKSSSSSSSSNSSANDTKNNTEALSGDNRIRSSNRTGDKNSTMGSKRSRQHRMVCSFCGHKLVGGQICPCRPRTGVNHIITPSNRSTSIRQPHCDDDDDIVLDHNHDDDDDGAQVPNLVTATAATEQWTEFMAVAHVVQDELHRYIVKQQQQQQQRPPWSTSDQTFFDTWAQDVHQQLKLQNDLVLENIEIVDAQRSAGLNLNKELGKILNSTEFVFVEICFAFSPPLMCSFSTSFAVPVHHPYHICRCAARTARQNPSAANGKPTDATANGGSAGRDCHQRCRHPVLGCH